MPFDDNLDFTFKLNKLIEQTKFLKTRYNAIAVYGYGNVGRIVAPLLKGNLIGILDQTATGDEWCEGVHVCNPAELKNLQADCVVITVLGRESEITRILRDDLYWQGEIFTYVLKSSSLNFSKAYTPKDSRRLSELKGRFKGNRCVIIGNGPSLNQCDLKRIENEFTFGVNGIFYKTEEMGFRPTFYVVEDSHVIEDNIESINDYACAYKFFPAVYKNKITKNKNVYFFNYECGFYLKNSNHYCKPRFSFDASEAVFAGQTVTYTNMQLAVYLGFTNIFLVGVDFSYVVPKTTEIIGDTYISNEEDPNHFHPAYFGKGKKWHDPKLDRVMMNFQYAKAALLPLGMRIFNATKGGLLELFPRADYDQVFTGSMKN